MLLQQHTVCMHALQCVSSAVVQCWPNLAAAIIQ